MDIEKRCSKCGGSDFKEGMLGKGYANVMDSKSLLTVKSNVAVIFCKECGEIISMRVTNPEKFN